MPAPRRFALRHEHLFLLGADGPGERCQTDPGNPGERVVEGERGRMAKRVHGVPPSDPRVYRQGLTSFLLPSTSTRFRPAIGERTDGVTVHRTTAHTGGQADGPGSASGDHSMVEAGPVLAAVREDIRQTLRMGWMEPAFEALSDHPAFFTAGWSAIRPNVGRTFLSLAKAVREEAASSARPLARGAEIREKLRPHVSEEELRRVEEVARAVHIGMPKVQIAVHALYRAARRERVAGTGQEEPPIRRGVPDWQRWMAA